MNNNTERTLLFLLGCIGIRSLFVHIAKTTDPSLLPYLGALALIPAIGMLYIFANGLRKTGPEVFGDVIWWNDLRPIHSMLYLSFAVTAIYQYKYAWVFLLIDVIIALMAFMFVR